MSNQLKREKRAIRQRYYLNRRNKRLLPVLKLFRSNKHIYAQIVLQGHTLAYASSLKITGQKTDLSRQVGKLIADSAIKQNIEQVVFDRSGFIFTGRVKALADAAREHGLKF